LQRVQLRWRGGLPAYGARCRVHGTLRAARPPRNFFGFDERALLEAQGLAAVIEVDSLRGLDAPGGPAWRRHLTEPLRTRIESTLHATLDAGTAAVLAALCVGVRDRIAPDVNEAWRALGLSHLLSISGMHVGLVAAALLFVVGSPRRPRGCIALLTGVIGYAAVGGLGPAVLRSAGMAVWAAIAVYVQRGHRPLVGLGVVSLALVVATPEKRHDVGLQLSCLATFGILAWAAPLTRVAQRLRAHGWRGGVAAWLVVGIGASLAAQLATLPLALQHFGYLSWLSLPANLVVVPLANAGLMLAIVGAPLQL
jgi:competence protein ComEC